MDCVLTNLGRCGLGDGVLVDTVGHGVFFVLLLELLEGDEGLDIMLVLSRRWYKSK